jgi:GH25 family lysozyme M1 (1,4-beta-N-acetylmuramidase)
MPHEIPETPADSGNRPVRLPRLLVLALLLVAGTAAVTSPAHATSHVWGISVTGYDAGLDWNAARADGASFAYIKASEGVSYRNPSYSQQSTGASNAGLLRGAFHFARPNLSGGRAQATFLVQSGGTWSPGNQILPAAVDLEPNPYSGGYCYGLSQRQMVQWIDDFATEYRSLTGRHAVIHTTASWWQLCTGSSTRFGQTNPLWVASAGSPPVLPAGWSSYTFWQNGSCEYLPGTTGCVPVSVYNSDYSQLVAFANGGG